MKFIKILTLTISCLIFCSNFLFAQQPDYKNAELPIDNRVASLLSEMTIEEKIAEMTTQGVLFDENGKFDFEKNREFNKYGFSQAWPAAYEYEDYGNYLNTVQKFNIEHTRLGIPAIVGAEGLHSFMVKGTTVFPQAIALASTWDIELVENVSSAIALEMRSVGTHRALGPVLDLARDPRWGRVEETFGEDPYLLSRIGLAFTNGLQGRGEELLDQNHAISHLKHFVAHGQPEGALNTGPANFSERILRENHLYPFEVAVKKGKAMGVMVTYHEIDGVPMTANHQYVTSILKEEWDFDGYIGPDYGAIDHLVSRHHVAEDSLQAAKLAIDAGIHNIGLRYSDNFLTVLELYKQELITIDQIDAAVAPKLRLKFLLGLFEDPYVDESLQKQVFNSEPHRKLALEAAHKSVILLKNEKNLLPLDADKIKNLAVIGPNAAGIHLGVYTQEPRIGISVLEGMENFAKGKFNVKYAEGCKITVGVPSWISNDVVELSDPEDDAKLIKEAVEVAKKSDVVLLVLGGNEETSREAWDEHLGDRESLELLGMQNELVNEILKTGKPVVVLLLNGRPLTINYLAENVPAILEGWYLGQETGPAVADVLFGKVNPGGKLPITFPRSVGQIPCYYNKKPSQIVYDYAFADSSPLYPFGFGLSYTTFEYRNLKVARASIAHDQDTEVTVEVSNTGDVSGDEVVQMYIRDMVSSVTRPVRELKGFKRITLEPGETKTVTLSITPEKLQFYDIDMERVVEAGEFEIMVGTNSLDYQSVILNVR